MDELDIWSRIPDLMTLGIDTSVEKLDAALRASDVKKRLLQAAERYSTSQS